MAPCKRRVPIILDIHIYYVHCTGEPCSPVKFMKDNGENNVNFSFNIRCGTNANRFGTRINHFTYGACFIPQLHNA